LRCRSRKLVETVEHLGREKINKDYVCVYIYIYVWRSATEGGKASLGKEKALRCNSRKLPETVERLKRRWEGV